MIARAIQYELSLSVLSYLTCVASYKKWVIRKVGNCPLRIAHFYPLAITFDPDEIRGKVQESNTARVACDQVRPWNHVRISPRSKVIQDLQVGNSKWAIAHLVRIAHFL